MPALTIANDPTTPGPSPSDPAAFSPPTPSPPPPSFIPLEPTNPDSEISRSLIDGYNKYRQGGGRDEDLAYEDLQNVASVAKGMTTKVDPMEVLTNPDLYYQQVYKAGKAPAMAEDVLIDAAKNPLGAALSGIDWAAQQGVHLADAAIHGVHDIVSDNLTSLNPWASQEDRDMASARTANGILRGVKGGVTMVPQLLQGAKEMVDYGALKAKLDHVTDPTEREGVERQISEVLRNGELRAAQNDEGVKNAYKDLQGILNATGVSAAIKGLGLPDRVSMLGADKAQPSEGQAMILGMISDPTNLVTAGAGELIGTIKSAVRMGAFEKEVKALNTIERQVTSLAAQRTATTAAIANATDDTVKAGLRQDLSRIAAQEKETAAIHATQTQKVNDLGAGVTKQINDVAPGIFAKTGAAGSGALAKGMDGIANLVENFGKVPGVLAERIVGSNATTEAKASMTSVLSGMAQQGLGAVGAVAGFHLGGILGAGAGGYVGAKLAPELMKMIGSPEALRTIARDAKVVGDQLALGKQTLPALQVMAEKLSGLNSGIASMLDNPTVRSIPSMMAGGATGALAGGALGVVQSGGTAQGFGQGMVQGGLFGAAGAGHGQLRSFNSSAELHNAAIGDRKRFIATLNPDHRQIFNKLRPDTQLAIGVFAHAHPDMEVTFVDDPKGPNGKHYITDEGGHVVLNTASDNPLEAVLTHEIAHHIVEHGLQNAVTDHILGNPATGHIGLFTHLDENGKPVVVRTEDPLTGTMRESYMPDQRLLQYQSEYNARKLRDLPDERPEDLYGISQEVFAELTSHMFTNREQMQKLIRGVGPSDLVSTSAISNFFSKLGLPFDARTGGMVAHPDQIKNIQGLNDIVTEYVKGRQFKNHPLEYEDGYSRIVPDAWRADPNLLYRNLDGAGIIQRDPRTGDPIKGADGLPIIRSAKEADKEHARFGQTVTDLIRANPSYQSTDIKAGWVLMKDRNGRDVYRTQNVPAEIFDKMAALNQYNPFQLANWQKINGLTMRDDGSVMQANYNTAKGKGGKYATVEVKLRSLVPLYSEASPKTNQVNIQAYDPSVLMNNLTRMLKRKAAENVWGSASDALADVHTYLENLAAGKPGETNLGLQKKQLINAMFGVQVDANPLLEQIRAKIPSVFKTFRLDRANKVQEVTGVTRPVYSGTYEQVRAFMQPRLAPATPEEQAAALGRETVPVTTYTTKTGSVKPVKYNYGITSAPLVSEKQPPKNLSENEFGHVDFMTKPEQQKLTHLNKASAVTDYADKLVGEYDKYKNEDWAVEAKDWYGHVRKQLKIAFGGDQELFAHLLAATSPQQGVVQNFKDAFEAYKQYRSGAYDDAIREYKRTGKVTPDMQPKKANGALFGANSDEVLKVFAGTWLDEVKGPKTPNFFENLFQRGTKATIDKWAARTMRRLGHEGVEGAPEQWRLQPKSERGVSNLDFAFSQEAFKQAADRVGMKPHELQAVMWYAEKHHWAERGYSKGGAAAAKASYIPMLTEYAQHVSAGGGTKAPDYLRRLQQYTPVSRTQ